MLKKFDTPQNSKLSKTSGLKFMPIKLHFSILRRRPNCPKKRGSRSNTEKLAPARLMHSIITIIYAALFSSRTSCKIYVVVPDQGSELNEGFANSNQLEYNLVMGKLLSTMSFPSVSISSISKQ